MCEHTRRPCAGKLLRVHGADVPPKSDAFEEGQRKIVKRHQSPMM